MGDIFNPKHGGILALTFSKADCTTSMAAVDLTLSYLSGTTLFVPPTSGSVISLSAVGNAAVTAGSMAFRAHKDSTEFAQAGYPTVTLSTASGQTLESYASIRPGVLTFAAGEGVGVSVTSTSTLEASNSIDVATTMIVQLDPWDAG